MPAFLILTFKKVRWKSFHARNMKIKDKVVFWTNIDENSDIAQLIKGEKKSSEVQSATPTVNSAPTITE